MGTLRLRMGLLVAWIWLLSNLRSLSELVPMSPSIGTVALVVALVLIAFPRLAKLSAPWLALPPILLWILVGLQLTQPFLGLHRPQVFLGAAILLLTTFLAARVAQSVQEFFEALSHVLLPSLRRKPDRFQNIQRELYREVRRARLSHQPLTLLAISPHRNGDTALPEPLAQEAMRTWSQEYIYGRVLEFLCEEAKDCDMVARLNNHLVTVLPLTTAAEAAETARRLCEGARERLGLHLAIGKASFPDEEVTLVGLMERALAGMRRHAACDRPPPATEPNDASPSRSATDSDGSLDHAPNDHVGVDQLAPVDGQPGNS